MYMIQYGGGGIPSLHYNESISLGLRITKCNCLDKQSGFSIDNNALLPVKELNSATQYKSNHKVLLTLSWACKPYGTHILSMY